MEAAPPPDGGTHGLKPHRVASFKLSTDPAFVAKLRDVVGLYLDPPKRAVVFSVDEQSQIQALDRTQPGLPLKKGRAGPSPMPTNATAPRRSSPRWTSPPDESSTPVSPAIAGTNSFGS